LWLDDETEMGIIGGVKKPHYSTILIVTSISEEGFVDYTFSAEKPGGQKK